MAVCFLDLWQEICERSETEGRRSSQPSIEFIRFVEDVRAFQTVKTRAQGRIV
jgi:hypothetical protein